MPSSYTRLLPAMPFLEGRYLPDKLTFIPQEQD